MFMFERNGKFSGTFGDITDPADFIIEKKDDKIVLTLGDKIIEGNCARQVANDIELKEQLLNPESTRIALTSNVGVVEQISVEHDCTLDLNNKTITFAKSKSNVPISCDKGTLKIENGILDATTAKNTLVPICAWGGILILDDITVISNTASESCVFCEAGEVIINGGKYINTNMGRYEYGDSAPLVLNIKNGSNGKITCYGGFFAGRDPALGDDQMSGTFVAEGYESVPATVNGYKGYIVRKKQ